MPRFPVGGYSLNFNGATHKVIRTVETAYNLVNYSIAFWVKGAAQSDKVIFGEGSSSTNNPIIEIEASNAAPNNKIKVLIRDDANATALSVTSSKIVFDNYWHHVVWTDANGVAKLYVDGVLDQVSFNYTRGTLTLNRTSVGGLQRSGFTNPFVGNVDKVRVYNVVLTLAQILSLFHQDAAIAGRVIDWEFNEGSGLVAVDTSGNGNNGMITDATYSTNVLKPARSLAT